MIKRLEFSGTPREIGLQHGTALKDEIHELYQKFMATFLNVENNPPSERSILGVTNAYLDVTEQYAPDLVEEMEGIAEGAEIELEKVLFLNYFDEMGLYSKLRATPSHCTLLIGTDRATADHYTYLGQGWDMEPFFIPIIMQIKPKNGPKMLMISHPGIVGGAGINENGVALVWSTLKAADERVGLGVIFLIRKALNSRNLNEALRPLINIPRACGFNFIVGNEFGGFNIEATALKEHVSYVTDIHAHANNYQNEKLKEIEDDLRRGIPDTIIRTGRMRQLLERYYGKIDLNICKDILCDHANYPAGICRHITPEGYNASETKSALIFLPHEKKMLASDGQPCEAGFDTFTFNDESL